MGKEASFYAVQAGKKPGVYSTWAQCQQQTKGFTGAKYKKFNNKAEAEAFVKSAKALGNVKDTVIKKGKKESEVAKKAAKAVSKSKAKAPEPDQEEDEMEDQDEEADGSSQDEEEGSEMEDQSQDEDEGEEGEGEENDEEEEGDDKEEEVDEEKVEEEEAVVSDENDMSPIEPAQGSSEEGSAEIIFVSGTSRGRGNKGICAGLGVYFGDEASNISERLSGPKQSNKRAELMAGIRALENAPAGKAIEIRTGSMYLVQGVTKWIPGWIKKDWKTAKGTDVENRDLFEALDKLVKEREPKPRWVHIPANPEVPGITKADELAIAGSKIDLSE